MKVTSAGVSKGLVVCPLCGESKFAHELEIWCAKCGVFFNWRPTRRDVPEDTEE